MTKFNFINIDKSLDFGFAERRTGEGPQENAVVSTTTILTDSLSNKMYEHVRQGLIFLQDENLIPNLPPVVDVVFTDANILERAANNYKRWVEKKKEVNNPEMIFPKNFYRFLGSTDPFPSTPQLYLSTYFIKGYLFGGNVFEAELLPLKQEFNGNIQKVIEQVLYHELGHLAIRTHVPRKEVQSSMHPFEQRIRNNIEEGFADAFSLHMMALKHGHVEFPVLRAHLFSQVKDDPFQEINLYRIYDKVPFRSADGSLLTDIKKITSRCLDAALNNNKEMLLECLADPYYEPQVKKPLNLNFTGSDNDYVDHFHSQYKKEGIVVNIKNFRSTMLGVNKHDSKNKI